jgi:hypothetical protein
VLTVHWNWLTRQLWCGGWPVATSFSMCRSVRFHEENGGAACTTDLLRSSMFQNGVRAVTHAETEEHANRVNPDLGPPRSRHWSGEMGFSAWAALGLPWNTQDFDRKKNVDIWPSPTRQKPSHRLHARNPLSLATHSTHATHTPRPTTAAGDAARNSRRRPR